MARQTIWLRALGLTLALTLAGGARAEPLLPPGWLEAQANEHGERCDRRGEHAHAGRVLVACGRAGAWEIELTARGPRLVHSHAFEGEVIGFISDGDGVWVKLHVLEARPLLLTAAPMGTPKPAPNVHFPEPTPTPPAVAPTPEVPSARRNGGEPLQATGRVLRSRPGEVVISLGRVHGIEVGHHIELSAEARAGEEETDAYEPLAVGRVTHIGEASARVRLGLNESVAPGALATPTSSTPSASVVAPPRVTGVWSLELLARPFAALDQLGGGVLLSAALGRRFEGHFHLRAALDPLATAMVDGGDSVSAASGAIVASYDSRYFEMGLGLGAQTVNSTDFLLQPGSGLNLVQVLRFGAADGLHLRAQSSVVLFHSEFDFGGLVMIGQIPVTRGYWLLLGGGGGVVGYGYGELGLRVLLSGNGGEGSRFLHVSAGGAAVFESGTCDEFFTCTGDVSYGGPMAGVGGEWRF
jgi:hypothetical protein